MAGVRCGLTEADPEGWQVPAGEASAAERRAVERTAAQPGPGATLVRGCRGRIPPARRRSRRRELSEGDCVQARTPCRMPPHQPAGIAKRAVSLNAGSTKRTSVADHGSSQECLRWQGGQENNTGPLDPSGRGTLGLSDQQRWCRQEHRSDVEGHHVVSELGLRKDLRRRRQIERNRIRIRRIHVIDEQTAHLRLLRKPGHRRQTTVPVCFASVPRGRRQNCSRGSGSRPLEEAGVRPVRRSVGHIGQGGTPASDGKPASRAGVAGEASGADHAPSTLTSAPSWSGQNSKAGMREGLGIDKDTPAQWPASMATACARF